MSFFIAEANKTSSEDTSKDEEELEDILDLSAPTDTDGTGIKSELWFKHIISASFFCYIGFLLHIKIHFDLPSLFYFLRSVIRFKDRLFSLCQKRKDSEGNSPKIPWNLILKPLNFIWSRNLVKLKRYKILTTFRGLNWILHSISSCPKNLAKMVWDKTEMTLIVDQGKVFENSQAIRFSNPVRILMKGCVRVITIVAFKEIILFCFAKFLLLFYCNDHDPIWRVFHFPGKKSVPFQRAVFG